MSHKKQIGLFGGSFDPIHLGHVNMAINMKEICGLDEIIFIPTGLSPFKLDKPPKANGHQRKEMLHLALNTISGFSVSDVELHCQGPCYTIDTVRSFSQAMDQQLYFLIAEDLLPTFHLWKLAEELVTLSPLLIGVKQGPGETISVGRKVVIPWFDISSTLVRMRLVEKKYCGHLLNPLVLDYILKNNLYV